MTTLITDIKYGIRQLIKRPAFTMTAALILALGIGANTALFSIIHGVLLSPFKFPDSERLMMVEPRWENGDLNGSSSYPDYVDWQERNTVFEELSAFSMVNMNLTKAGDALTVKGFSVTPNFFKSVYDGMALGRGFEPGEDLPGRFRVAVLSYSLWRDRYGCDPDILNQTIDIDKMPYTVVGVASASMDLFDDFTQIYVPFERERLAKETSRGSHFLIVFGRLKTDTTLAQAQSQMSQIAKQLGQEYPGTNRTKGIGVTSLHERLVSDIRVAFYILYGAVTLLLLTACTNISNLLIAHASTRRREMAIRQALGGGRWRLMRQLLTESLILGLAGCALGLILGQIGLVGLKAIAPRLQATDSSIPGFSDIHVNLPVLGFTVLLALVASLIFGVVPAWQGSGFHLSRTLKETVGNLSGGSKRHRTLGTLVIAQIALAFVIFTGATLLIKSFTLLQHRDPGFKLDGLLALHIARSELESTNENLTHTQFFTQTTEQLAALTGVDSAGAISLRPLSSDNNNGDTRIIGNDQGTNTETRIITPDYFHCMGIPLCQGRPFNLNDNPDSQAVVIVNKALVQRLLPDRNPLGQQLEVWGKPRTIVGVVGNVTRNNLRSEGYHPFAYLPHLQRHEYEMTVFMRTQGDPMTYAQAARQVIRDIDDNQPILYISTMANLAMASISLDRFCTILIAIMASVALAMALVGLYAVMAFSVNERRSEVGIRMALGAEQWNILFLVIKKAFVLTLVGLVVGLAGALAVSRTLGSLLFEISSWDLSTFILVPVLLFIVAMLACYIPARKAMKLDPMKVLRYE